MQYCTTLIGRQQILRICVSNPFCIELYIVCVLFRMRGRDSLVGIATCYGLEGRGIESRWGRDFPRPYRRPTQPSIKWVPGLFRGSRAAGAWR